MRKKLKVGLRDRIFFKAKNLFFLFLVFNKMCIKEIEDNNEKICSRFSDTVSHKFEFTAHGLFWGHPCAWGLTLNSVLPKTL